MLGEAVQAQAGVHQRIDHGAYRPDMLVFDRLLGLGMSMSPGTRQTSPVTPPLRAEVSSARLPLPVRHFNLEGPGGRVTLSSRSDRPVAQARHHPRPALDVLQPVERPLPV
jgi:hypothetical protein